MTYWTDATHERRSGTAPRGSAPTLVIDPARRSAPGTPSVGMPPAVRPLLRWAGSKRAIVPTLLASLPPAFDTYFEPFAGSAALLFALQPKVATIGDLNAELIGTYRAVADDARSVHSVMSAWPLTPETYYAVRAITPATLNGSERAARFIYLNRRSFNGVYRTNQRGLFNVPVGARTGPLPDLAQLEAIAHVLQRCAMTVADFESSLADAESGAFVFLDPPYPTDRNHYGEYGYSTESRAATLARVMSIVRDLDGRGVKFMLSLPAAMATGSPWNARLLTVHRKVGAATASRGADVECLLTNY